MAISVKGFDDISSTMDQLGDVGKKVGRKAIKNGLEEVLDQLKKDAPEDKEGSKDKLSIQHIRMNKNGSVWGACGIGSNNFSSTKQLWYQNYGYENWGLNFKGDRIENNVGWIDKSFKKVENKAEDIIVKVLSAELNKVLK